MARLPELEEETAVANIALDLLGQARLLLSRAGGIAGRTEDQLAFFREEKEFRSVRLAEHDDRDFAELVVRLLIFSTWRLALFEELSPAPDPVLAAIAAKGVNELAYHRDYAARWVIRLGDGTPVSHAKTQAALDNLWPLVGELFRPDPDALATVAPGRLRRGPRHRAGHGRPRPPHRRRARPGRRPDRPRRRAHRGDGLHPGRAPVRRPRPPGRDLVTAMTEQTNAYQVAASTPDPELPMLTIEDLGILRTVDYLPPGRR